MVIVGLVFGIISAVLLFNEPDTRPLENRTLNGQSESELRFIKETQEKNNFGFMFLGLSFLFQLIGLLIENKSLTETPQTNT